MPPRPTRPPCAARRHLVVAAALAAALVVAAGALAQAPPAGAAPAPGSTATHAQSLIRVLEDEAARGRLIEELGRVAQGAGQPAAPAPAAPGAAPPVAGDPPEGRPDPRPSLGDRVAAAVPAVLADLVGNVRDIWDELRATARRLGGFARLDTAELRRILAAVAPVAAATVAVGALARRAMLPVFRRLGARADRARVVRTAAIAIGAVLLDLLTVLLGAAAGVVATTIAGVEDAMLTTMRMTFVAAFMGAGALLVAIRAVFSPATPHLRPLPVDDAGARYWSSRLGIIAIVLAFGEIFVRALVAETSSPITARATLVVIYMIIGLYMIGLILVNARAPSRYFERRAAESDDDLTYSILAWLMRFWHYIAIGFLLALMHQVLTSGGGALPLVFAALEIAAAFAVGAFLVTLITQLGQGGVRVPARMNRALPALEERINAFVPAFLRLFRLVVLILWAAFALQVVGVLRLSDWLERRVGVDVVGATATVVLTVLAGFVAWLAVASWVDYRIAPRRGQLPTSRERTLLSLLRNAATVAILIIGLMFTLSGLGISIAPLLASAGVLGLAIGFGAQRMVEDIIGGIFIQFENAINVGDVVQAAGTTGVVEKLTIRSVALRDLQGVYHVIPFSSVTTVSNHTKGFGYHVADIRVAYRESIEEAKAEMLAAYDDLRADAELGGKLIGDLEWFGVETLGESGVVLRARLKTWPGDQWMLGRAYNERVQSRFSAAGIQIPFPHLTLWFGAGKDGTAPPAGVALGRRGAGAPPPAAEAAPAPEARSGTRIRRDSPTDAETEPDADGDADR